MSTANVAAMIDHLVVRYRLSSATARADCLGWLQLAEERAWSAGEWWFKRARQDVAIVGGTSVYSLNLGDTRVHALEDGDGRLLQELHPSDFRAFVGNDVTSGTVALWTRLERSSAGTPRVEVWPVPDGAETFKVVYDGVRETLADSATSKGGFPDDWRHLVLLRAEVFASLHLGQQGQAEGFMASYNEGIVALGGRAEAISGRSNTVRAEVG